MKLPSITLIRSNRIQLFLFGFLALLLFLTHFNEDGLLPVWIRAVAGLVIGLGILIMVFIPKEKADERADKNLFLADSGVFNLLYVLSGIALASTIFIKPFTITSIQILYGFIAVHVFRSALFLYYEKYGD